MPKCPTPDSGHQTLQDFVCSFCVGSMRCCCRRVYRSISLPIGTGVVVNLCRASVLAIKAHDFNDTKTTWIVGTEAVPSAVTDASCWKTQLLRRVCLQCEGIRAADKSAIPSSPLTERCTLRGKTQFVLVYICVTSPWCL